MGLKDQLRRLEREAERDAVLIRQRHGTTKGFDTLTVQMELYLLMLSRGLGEPPRSSEFMDALANATPESRREVEALAGGKFYEDLYGEPPQSRSRT